MVGVENFGPLLRGYLVFMRSFKSCRCTALSSICTKTWLTVAVKFVKLIKRLNRIRLSIPYYSGE